MHPVFLSLLLACGGSPEPAPDADATEETPEAADESFGKAMTEHFDYATAARNSIIRGDLEGAKLVAQEMSTLTAPDVPDTWAPHLANMKSAADELGQAADMDAAAQGVGKLAKTCGDCHTATGGGPRTQAKDAANPARGRIAA